MNRRGFLNALLKAGAGFSILPPATTYARIWRAHRPPPQLAADWSTGPIQYRANLIGIRAQLQACSLTRCSIKPFTHDEFSALAAREVIFNQVLAKEAQVITDEATARAFVQAFFGDRSRDKIA